MPRIVTPQRYSIWKMGELANWRIGEWASWRIGELENWQMGEFEPEYRERFNSTIHQFTNSPNSRDRQPSRTASPRRTSRCPPGRQRRSPLWARSAYIRL